MEISLLPDDIIKYIMQFWSPKHERLWRRIVLLMGHLSGYTTFQDPNTYLVKLMTLPRPRCRYQLYDYHFTKCCFIVNTHGNGKNKRINLKTNLQKYHAYLQQEIVPTYRCILRAVMEKNFNRDYTYHELLQQYSDKINPSKKW
jgi:hypothetical protein